MPLLGDVRFGTSRLPTAVDSIVYRTHHLAAAYRPDLVVSDKIIVEVKAVEKVLPVHDAQVLTYLKLTGFHIGLLFNFNTTSLVAGMKRISL